tara:strand:+ start:2231 stop:2740 length:510 start_codon:yes stop_codon:yes gene_type:complete
MANLNKPTFAVSVTPAVLVQETDDAVPEHTVIHESVRKSLSGNGTVTGDDSIIDDTNNNGSTNNSWQEGVNTAVTSNGSIIAFDTSTDLIYIKHTGLLFGSTASAAADTVKIAIDGSATSGVSGDGVIIAELANEEAMVLPRPGIAGAYIFVTGNGSNHVGVETLIVGT